MQDFEQRPVAVVFEVDLAEAWGVLPSGEEQLVYHPMTYLRAFLKRSPNEPKLVEDVTTGTASS